MTVFVFVPVTRSFATSVMVVVAPLAMLPTLQVTVVTLFAVAFAHVPWLAVTLLSSALKGSLSTATTPVAASGPLFATVIV